MQFFDNKIFIALCVMLFLAPQALWAPKVQDVEGLQAYVTSLGGRWTGDKNISDEQAQHWKDHRTYYENRDVTEMKLEGIQDTDFRALLTRAGKLPQKAATAAPPSSIPPSASSEAPAAHAGPHAAAPSLRTAKEAIGSSTVLQAAEARGMAGTAQKGTEILKIPGRPTRTKFRTVIRATLETMKGRTPATTHEGDLATSETQAEQFDRRTAAANRRDQQSTATTEGSGRPAAQPARVESGDSTFHAVVSSPAAKSSGGSADSLISLPFVPPSPTRSSSTRSVGSFDSEDSEDPSSRTVAAPAVKLRRNEIGSRGAALRTRVAPKTREELLRGLESYGKSSRETEIAAKLEKLSENISGHEQAGTLHTTVGATSTTNAQALEDKLFALKHEHAKAFGTKQDRAALKKEYQELLKSRKAASRQAAAPKEPPHSAPEASPQTPLKTSPHSPGSTFGKTVGYARRQPAQR